MYSDCDTLAGGLPHSDIHGSKPARGSPWLFAACHVLHRLLVPRHPPNALITLDILSMPSQGMTPNPSRTGAIHTTISGSSESRLRPTASDNHTINPFACMRPYATGTLTQHYTRGTPRPHQPKDHHNASERRCSFHESFDPERSTETAKSRRTRLSVRPHENTRAQRRTRT